MKKSNVAVTLSMLAVFGSGAVVGALGHRLYMVRSVNAGVPTRLSPEQWRQKYMGELSSRLKLDQTQVSGINAILDDTRDQYRAVKERGKSDMETIHTRQVERISALLSPQQKTEYDNFRDERDRARKEAEKKKAGSAH
jgi:hypothetical protein